jgi:hypothetical protein
MSDNNPDLRADVAAGLEELRQLIFTGLVAAAKAAVRSPEADEAWENVSKVDAKLTAIIEKLAPGTTKE